MDISNVESLSLFLRESLSVPPFTRAFLKLPSSSGLSAIAELLVLSIFFLLTEQTGSADGWAHQLQRL